MARPSIPPATTGADSRTSEAGLQQGAPRDHALTRAEGIRLEPEADDSRPVRPAARSRQASAFEDPAPLARPVIALDFSAPGLRVTYRGRPLKPGQLVTFGQRGMMLRAQVLWTRQSGESVQSGLIVQSRDLIGDQADR